MTLQKSGLTDCKIDFWDVPYDEPVQVLYSCVCPFVHGQLAKMGMTLEPLWLGICRYFLRTDDTDKI